MSKLFLDITMSLDGFITGPDPNPELGLGRGGEALHEWAVELKSFHERHGREGEGEESRDSDILDEAFERSGSFVMGRNMFDPIGGPWDENSQLGWWGDDPPFNGPVFIVTHHEREPLQLGDTTFTFVTDGVESAVEQARDASGGKDVSIAGGAKVFQQALRAGLVDEFQIHIAPMLLGEGTRLFEEGSPPPVEFEITRVLESAPVTHIRYEVKR
jgi:dihydrofolate reductase